MPTRQRTTSTSPSGSSSNAGWPAPSTGSRSPTLACWPNSSRRSRCGCAETSAPCSRSSAHTRSCTNSTETETRRPHRRFPRRLRGRPRTRRPGAVRRRGRHRVPHRPRNRRDGTGARLGRGRHGQRPRRTAEAGQVRRLPTTTDRRGRRLRPEPRGQARPPRTLAPSRRPARRRRATADVQPACTRRCNHPDTYTPRILGVRRQRLHGCTRFAGGRERRHVRTFPFWGTGRRLLPTVRTRLPTGRHLPPLRPGPVVSTSTRTRCDLCKRPASVTRTAIRALCHHCADRLPPPRPPARTRYRYLAHRYAIIAVWPGSR